MRVSAPSGILGVVVEGSPAAWLALDAGVGVGADGAQLAGMGRLRLPIGPVALAVGSGLSSGPFADDHCFETDCAFRKWSSAYWFNTEASFEMHAQSGFEWRIYVGHGAILNDANVCHHVSPTDAPYSCRGAGYELLYGGGAIGYDL